MTNIILEEVEHGVAGVTIRRGGKTTFYTLNGNGYGLRALYRYLTRNTVTRDASDKCVKYVVRN